MDPTQVLLRLDVISYLNVMEFRIAMNCFCNYLHKCSVTACPSIEVSVKEKEVYLVGTKINEI